jgi:hypothetical protein
MDSQVRDGLEARTVARRTVFKHHGSGEIGCSVCALTSDEHWRHAGFPDLETRCLERNYSRRRRGTAQAKVTAVLRRCFGVTVSSRSCHREG